MTLQDPKELMKKIGRTDLKYLGKGMQSMVFEIDDKTILKVYGKEIGLKNITRLKDFYKSLESADITFQTPMIITINEHKEHILVTERRLKGVCPTKNYLSASSSREIKKFLTSYAKTIFQIQNIECKFLENFEPLDTSGHFFEFRDYRTWNELILHNLSTKSDELIRIVPEKREELLRSKEQIERKVLSIPNIRPTLIHGDFFPANTLIDKNYSINSVLDFGILTTKGDPIFDIALGWVFSDMYNDINKFDIKSFLKPILLDRLKTEETERFHLYILIYSFISANMYSRNDPDEGHLKWCLHNLQDKTLLRSAGI